MTGEHWQKEISVYRSIEQWGLTLIATGIGAVIYNCVEWTSSTGALSQAPRHIILAPVIAGVFGMLFLRIVNYRYHWARARFNELNTTRENAQDENGEEKSSAKYDKGAIRNTPGLLGLLIALIPLVEGLAGSFLVKWSLSASNTFAVWQLILVALFPAVIIEVGHRVACKRNIPGGNCR